VAAAFLGLHPGTSRTPAAVLVFPLVASTRRMRLFKVSATKTALPPAGEEATPRGELKATFDVVAPPGPSRKPLMLPLPVSVPTPKSDLFSAKSMKRICAFTWSTTISRPPTKVTPTGCVKVPVWPNRVVTSAPGVTLRTARFV
jgi:hypothetical protein